MPRLGGDIGTMIRLSTFTPRMWLILAHDLLATAAAVVASFFIRFEEAGLTQRWRLLVDPAAAFLVYAGFVYGFSGLYKAKWRFTSLPDLYNIVRAETVLAVTLLALDYVLLAPNFYGTFFFGKITIVLYWLLQIAFLSRSAHRLPLFPLHPYSAARQGGGFDADADRGAHGRCRSAVARDRERRGHQIAPRRHPVAVAVRSRPSDPRHFRARRSRRHRAASLPISQIAAPTLRGSCSRRARWCRKRSRKRS